MNLQSRKMSGPLLSFFVLFKEIQRGITPGQFAAFYIDSELVASGVIQS